MKQSRSEKTPPANRSAADSGEHSKIQTKLKVGSANNHYEKEADRTADSVVNMPGKETAPVAQSVTPLVQREAEEEETAQGKIQRKGEEEEAQTMIQKQEEEEPQTKLQKQGDEEVQEKAQQQEDEEAQTKRNGENGPVTSKKTESKVRASKGSGAGMASHHQSFMESKFGADFSSVRIHNDPSSHEMNKELNAQAFTVGKDIYFASGKYDPDAKKGKHLLAHELTHTLQQSSSLRARKKARGKGEQ